MYRICTASVCVLGWWGSKYSLMYCNMTSYSHVMPSLSLHFYLDTADEGSCHERLSAMSNRAAVIGTILSPLYTKICAKSELLILVFNHQTSTSFDLVMRHSIMSIAISWLYGFRDSRQAQCLCYKNVSSRSTVSKGRKKT